MTDKSQDEVILRLDKNKVSEKMTKTSQEEEDGYDDDVTNLMHSLSGWNIKI